jgi:hypothetical protein
MPYSERDGGSVTTGEFRDAGLALRHLITVADVANVGRMYLPSLTQLNTFVY